MKTSEIRTKLHDYIDNGDIKLVKLMFALAEEYNSIEDYSFSKEDIEIFEQRRSKRLKGESKVYNWADAKAIITGKKTA